MAEKIICPNCKKDSYSLDANSYSLCPYCDYVFSSRGGMGPNQRTEHRLPWSAYCHIFAKDIRSPGAMVLLAKTQDISRNGAKVGYVGEPLIVGDTVNIYIKDLNLRRVVTVMWSKTVNEAASVSGLKFIESIPIPLYRERSHGLSEISTIIY